MSQIIQSTKLVNGVDLKTPPLPNFEISKIGEAPEKLIVACVWWGTKYGIEYVEKLRNSVKRNLTIPYEMVCITDHDEVPEGVRKIPTPSSSEGWWQKVNLFKEGVFPNDTRIMYLDLDIVVTNSLDMIARHEGEFVMIKNFSRNERHAAFNSSCMIWTPTDKTKRIYDCFCEEVTDELHGDQCWVWRVMHNNAIKTIRLDLAESYKYNKRSAVRRESNDTALWVFHGEPNPHEVTDKKIVSNWV